MIWRLVILLFLTSSCCYRPSTHEYRCTYAHLEGPIPVQRKVTQSDYYIVFLVDARHLDYSDTRTFLKTTAKHPSDGSKNGDVGHSWIYLRGLKDGQEVIVEGGHSGERGLLQARYWEGILNGNDYGYANPTEEQRQNPRYEPNPVKYLWESQPDGLFEQGTGAHNPTFAAKIDLTPDQFEKILSFIDPKHYDYTNYSLTDQQCSTYVGHVAALIDFHIEHQVVLKLEPEMDIAGKKLRLWTDPQYSNLIFSSPDRVERSLIEAVREGKAQNAMNWYYETHGESGVVGEEVMDKVKAFPARFVRFLII
jgi:hypothetical protein